MPPRSTKARRTNEASAHGCPCCCLRRIATGGQKSAYQHSGGCERPCAARPDWCLPPRVLTGSLKIFGRNTVVLGPSSPAREDQEQEKFIRNKDNCRDSLKTNPGRQTDVRIVLLCNQSAGLQKTGMGLRWPSVVTPHDLTPTCPLY